MNATCRSNDEQAMLWNGSGGRAWVDAQNVLDQMFAPLEDLLVEAVITAPVRRVLDVGCGTGSTSLAIARLFGPRGRCVGIDISSPMIASAQARAEKEGRSASFIQADAQIYPFEPASFDAIISRFGVMFFDDPVSAFANLRRAAAHDALLQFVAWRGAAENPFMTTAERAAAPLLPNMPVRQPDAPGQFAFADPRRVRHILQESGWVEIDIRAINVSCALPESALMGYLARLGPVGRLLHEADEQTRAEVIDTVRAAFDSYVCGCEVRYNAACWMVGARSSTQPIA
jgi:SAM-dependent methyltransferase